MAVAIGVHNITTVLAMHVCDLKTLDAVLVRAAHIAAPFPCPSKTPTGLTATIITNGRQMTYDLLDLFHESGLFAMQISIHSWDPSIHDRLTGIVGSYEQAIRTLRRAVSLGITVNVNSTLTGLNMDVAKTCGAMREQGAHSYSITRYAQTRPGLDHLIADFAASRQRIIELLDYGRDSAFRVKLISPFPLCAFRDENEARRVAQHMSKCDGGQSWVTITPNGVAKPCPPWALDCGSLGSGRSLKEVWQKSEMLNKIRAHGFIPDECRQCRMFQICRTGCRACAAADGSPHDVTDPLRVVGALWEQWRTGSVSTPPFETKASE